MKEEVQRIQINSYASVWKVEHSIYSIGNMVLPVPIKPYDLLYMGSTVLVIAFLEKMLPFLASIPLVIKYLGIPYIGTTFMRKMKFDGKNPIRFFISYVRYALFEKEFYFERFRSYANTSKKYKMCGNCSVRYHRH